MKLQAYVTLKILCNPWIQSKIRRKAFENVKIWKQLVSIFFSNHCKPSWMAAERHKCYFNIFSVCLLRQLLPKEKAFFKITWQILSKLTKSVRNCDVITWIGVFRNFLLRYEPCIKNKELASWYGTKNIHKFLLFLHFKETFT